MEENGYLMIYPEKNADFPALSCLRHPLDDLDVQVLVRVLRDLGFADADRIEACDRKFTWCDRQGLVTNLRLVGAGLTGQLSGELGRLEALEYLGLDDNQLSGQIPKELGRLTRLEQLELSNNQFLGCVGCWK